jgi:hypothetical protein
LNKIPQRSLIEIEMGGNGIHVIHVCAVLGIPLLNRVRKKGSVERIASLSFCRGEHYQLNGNDVASVDMEVGKEVESCINSALFCCQLPGVQLAA